MLLQMDFQTQFVHHLHSLSIESDDVPLPPFLTFFILFFQNECLADQLYEEYSYL